MRSLQESAGQDLMPHCKACCTAVQFQSKFALEQAGTWQELQAIAAGQSESWQSIKLSESSSMLLLQSSLPAWEARLISYHKVA